MAPPGMSSKNDVTQTRLAQRCSQGLRGLDVFPFKRYTIPMAPPGMSSAKVRGRPIPKFLGTSRTDSDHVLTTARRARPDWATEKTEAMTRGRPTAMLFMILMIIGATLPAAATAPSHTPVPPATGADGGGAGGPSVAGDGDGSSAGAAVSRSLDNASETTALDMLGLAIPAQLRQAYGRARELLRDAHVRKAK